MLYAYSHRFLGFGEVMGFVRDEKFVAYSFLTVFGLQTI